MKKTLSILLVIMMLLSCVPAMAEYENHVEFTYLGNATSKTLPGDDAYVIQKLNEIFNCTIHSIDAVSNVDEQMQAVFADYDNIPDHFLIATKYLTTVLNQELTREIPISMIKEHAPTVWELIDKNYPQLKKTAVYVEEKDSLLCFPSGLGEVFPLFMVRQDWLDALNLEVPKTLEDFKKVAIAFAQNDPDGNGVADTWALNLSEAYDEIAPLCAAFGITLPEGSANQQDSWYIDEENKLAYKATTSPEFKELIKYLNELWDAGAIYPDMSLTNAEGDNLAAEGKIGFKHIATIEMLPTYSPQLWYAQMVKNVPGAYGTVVDPLEGSVFELQTSPWRYHCFGHDCSDEALIRILEIYEAQCTDMEIHKLIWSGEEGKHYDLVNGMAVKTAEFQSGPIQAGDALKWMIINFRHNADMQLFTFGHEYADIIKYHNKAGEEGAVSKVVNELIPFGVAKPTVDEYKAILDPFEKEFFYNAVAGKIDVEAEWDKYLADWATMGGEASAQEIYQLWKDMQ